MDVGCFPEPEICPQSVSTFSSNDVRTVHGACETAPWDWWLKEQQIIKFLDVARVLGNGVCIPMGTSGSPCVIVTATHYTEHVLRTHRSRRLYTNIWLWTDFCPLSLTSPKCGFFEKLFLWEAWSLIFFFCGSGRFFVLCYKWCVMFPGVTVSSFYSPTSVCRSFVFDTHLFRSDAGTASDIK